MALPAADWLTRPQPRLGIKGLLVLLVTSSLITPLSLDMYTPAVPNMTSYFATDVSMVNLTLVGYYVFFAIGMLVFGPLSDRYGRRPTMIGGGVLYTLGSAACAGAPNIEFLIAARVVQALGAGAVSAVCTACVKDSFQALYREKILSVIQVLFVIGPVTAPVIGAGVLAFADWRTTFWILAGVGVLCSILAMLFEETLPETERTGEKPVGTPSRLLAVGKNPGFMSFLLITSLFEIPFMGYIAVGSYIYIDFFGVGEIGYSAFFAAAAIIITAGPFIWLAASKRMSTVRFTTLMIGFSIAAGFATIILGQSGPYAFCACFVAFALAESCTRPYSMNILLEQQKRDAGSASALMNCIRTAIGAVGMALAALPWQNYVVGIGVLIVTFMAIAFAAWIALLKSGIPLACIKDESPIAPW